VLNVAIVACALKESFVMSCFSDCLSGIIGSAEGSETSNKWEPQAKTYYKF
jgi:hypothetical protein